MARKAVLTGLVVAVASTCAAAPASYNSSSCIDPGGFSACRTNADASYTECVDNNCKTQNIDCINTCECARSITYIDCAASSCWNEVYSCEYQLTVSDYINFCPNPDFNNIPYWPPPDNAPLGCSCPMGKVQYAILSDVDHLDACANNVTYIDELLSDDDVANYGEACTCCYQSGILSAIYDICPSTLPSLLGADIYFESLFTDTNWESCGIYLEAYNCITELGFSSPAENASNFYGPGDFPQNGTLKLFDTTGEGEIKTPVSGSVFTWTANGVARTVSAVGVTGRVTEGASVATVETGSRTGTLAPSATSTTSAASMLKIGTRRPLLGLIAAMLLSNAISMFF